MGRAVDVICNKLEQSIQFHDAVIAATNYNYLADDLRVLCNSVAQSIKTLSFPGALIPVRAADGSLVVYAVAPTISEWRRLNPLLVAFAGPTITSYTGLPSELPLDGDIEKLIRKAAPVTVGVIRLPTSNKGQIIALRALQATCTTIARAPRMQRAAPEPTSWLLASFQDLLNVGRREAAVDILRRLKEELRVDALNLKFLEVQLLASFSDWAAIVAVTGFSSLCIARRPPAITALLLESLYQVYLEPEFGDRDLDNIKSRYEEFCRPLAQPMFVTPLPATLTEGGLRMYALEAIVANNRPDIIDALRGHENRIAWLNKILPEEQSKVISGESLQAPASLLNQARAALSDADHINSIDSVASALSSINQLSDADLEQLKEAEPFKHFMRVVGDVGVPGGLPRSWLEWLTKVHEPSFLNSLEVARQGKDEWAIDETVTDPLNIQTFLVALEKALSRPIAAERTANAFPFMVAWLRRDPGFPRSAMGRVYSTLLTLFAMGASRERGIYESIQILIHALLAIGITKEEYLNLIADTEEVAGAGFGVEMVYWLLEIIEEFLRFSAPDPGARDLFLHSTLAKIAPIYVRLSGLQRTAIACLAQQMGWQLQSLGLPEASKVPADDLAAKLAGRNIAIYSLTESSSRQAKAALEQAVPGVSVDCNADHGGTQRLRALAENADLFVMTWQSAKHAATDFIRRYRHQLPLIYAQGRGFSSILRAIEDHVKSQRA